MGFNKPPSFFPNNLRRIIIYCKLIICWQFYIGCKTLYSISSICLVILFQFKDYFNYTINLHWDFSVTCTRGKWPMGCCHGYPLHLHFIHTCMLITFFVVNWDPPGTLHLNINHIPICLVGYSDVSHHWKRSILNVLCRSCAWQSGGSSCC